MLEIEKPDYNDEFRTVQFRRPDGKGQLNAEEVITACDILCAERSSGTPVADMVSEVAVYDQTQVRYRLKGGSPDKVYLLTVRITTSNGQKLAEKILVRVV